MRKKKNCNSRPIYAMMYDVRAQITRALFPPKQKTQTATYHLSLFSLLFGGLVFSLSFFENPKRKCDYENLNFPARW